jgi:hypothetical protein
VHVMGTVGRGALGPWSGTWILEGGR